MDENTGPKNSMVNPNQQDMGWSPRNHIPEVERLVILGDSQKGVPFYSELGQWQWGRYIFSQERLGKK